MYLYYTNINRRLGPEVGPGLRILKTLVLNLIEYPLGQSVLFQQVSKAQDRGLVRRHIVVTGAKLTWVAD